MGGATSKQARKLPTTSQSPKWAGARTPHPNPLYPDGSQPPPPSTSSTTTAQSVSKGAYDFNPSSGDLGNAGRGRSRGLEYGLADQGAEPGSTGKATAGFSGEKDDGESGAANARMGSDDIRGNPYTLYHRVSVLRDGRDPQFMSNLSRIGQVKIHDAGQFVKTPPQAQRTLSSRDPSLTSSNSLPPPGHLTSPILSNLFDRLKTLPPGTTPESVYKEYGMDPDVMRRLRRWVNSPSIGEEVTSVEEGEKKVELRAVWVDGNEDGMKRVEGR